MALLSELVRMIAKVEGLEEVSVGIFARHAREAGLIAQGGRGRSAAKMTFRDAANLLIAVNGCALAKQVSDSVPLFRGLLVTSNSAEEFSALDIEGDNFGEVLEHALRLASLETYADRPGNIFVRFFKPWPKVEIRAYPTYESSVVGVFEDKEGDQSSPWIDRSDETVISTVTLRAVAKLLND